MLRFKQNFDESTWLFAKNCVKVEYHWDVWVKAGSQKNSWFIAPPPQEKDCSIDRVKKFNSRSSAIRKVYQVPFWKKNMQSF